MKRLEKLRDELAKTEHHFDAFCSGFDAATKELMRVIEIQRGAIANEMHWRKIVYCTKDGKDNLGEAALKSYAILNGEVDGQ